MMSWVKGIIIFVVWSMDKAQWSLWIGECFVYQMRAAKRMQYIGIVFLLILSLSVYKIFCFCWFSFRIIFTIRPKTTKYSRYEIHDAISSIVYLASISFSQYWIKCSVFGVGWQFSKGMSRWERNREKWWLMLFCDIAKSGTIVLIYCNKTNKWMNANKSPGNSTKRQHPVSS